MKDLNEQFKGKCVLASSCNGWTIAQYLQEIIGKFSFSKRLLIGDSFKAHISDSTKQVLKDFKIESAIISGSSVDLIMEVKTVVLPP